MMQIKLTSALRNFTIFACLLITACSCRKEQSVQIIPAGKKIKTIYVNGAVVSGFSYNSKGLLEKYQTGNSWSDFDYPNGGFVTNWYSNGTLQTASQAEEMLNGRVTKMVSRKYTNGLPGSTFNYLFSYNADGTLKSYESAPFAYTFQYQNGDFTKVVRTKNGVEDAVYNYSYTDDISRFNIPLIEYLYALPFLTDGYTGAGNKHLMKSCMVLRANTITTTLFSYVLDQEGYVTSYTETTQKDNQAPVVTVFNIEYI